MSQSDIQFKAFVRFLLDFLKEANGENDEAKRAEKMAKIIDNLQKTMED